MTPAARKSRHNASRLRSMRRSHGDGAEESAALGMLRRMRGAAVLAESGGILHHGRDGNTHNLQATNQCPANDCDSGQQKNLSLLVWFAEDRMTVIEGVEKLSEMENMFCQEGRLSCSDALINHFRGLGGRQPEFPDFIGGFAG